MRGTKLRCRPLPPRAPRRCTLFLIDRSSESTTPIYEQERLLREVRGLLSDRQVLLVSSKVDITEEENSADDHRISSVTGHGLRTFVLI